MCRKLKYIVPALLMFSTSILAQKISTAKFGDIAYNMSQREVASLSNKLALYDTTNEQMPEQDIVINGIKYHVSYYNNLKKKQFEVYMVSSTNPSLSTLSGIKIGSTLSDLWKIYKKYDISVQNIFEDEETKSTRVFTINDLDNGCNLDFYLKNNKVVKIALMNESGYLNNNIYEN